jgi:ribosome recycling factor
MVDSYGEKQPLSAVAQIALKNPTLIVVNPFDGAVGGGRARPGAGSSG